MTTGIAATSLLDAAFVQNFFSLNVIVFNHDKNSPIFDNA